MTKRQVSVPRQPRFGDVVLCPVIVHRTIEQDGTIGRGVLKSMPADGDLAIMLYLGCAPDTADIDVEAALHALGWQRIPEETL